MTTRGGADICSVQIREDGAYDPEPQTSTDKTGLKPSTDMLYMCKDVGCGDDNLKLQLQVRDRAGCFRILPCAPIGA